MEVEIGLQELTDFIKVEELVEDDDLFPPVQLLSSLLLLLQELLLHYGLDADLPPVVVPLPPLLLVVDVHLKVLYVVPLQDLEHQFDLFLRPHHPYRLKDPEKVPHPHKALEDDQFGELLEVEDEVFADPVFLIPLQIGIELQSLIEDFLLLQGVEGLVFEALGDTFLEILNVVFHLFIDVLLLRVLHRGIRALLIRLLGDGLLLRF